jgi:hypothetical protein
MTSYALFLLLSLTPAVCFLMGALFAHKFLLQEVHLAPGAPLSSWEVSSPAYTGPTQWEAYAPYLADVAEEEWTDASRKLAA